jgi:CheY-like chemotaxis protein
MINKRFLIVDDDDDDCMLFTTALSAVAPMVSCDCATDGREALAHLENAAMRPDIIFLDINMPGMNGWDCLCKIQSNPQLRAIPVIILTTSSQKADKEKAKALGAICLFTKPDDFKRLMQMLAIVVEKVRIGDIGSVIEAIF